MLIIRCGYSWISFVPVSLYHFALLVAGRSQREWCLALSYFLSFIFLILVWTTDLFVEGFYEYSLGKYPDAGILHPLFLLFIAVLIVKAVIHFRNTLTCKDLPQVKRHQIKLHFASFIFYTLASYDFMLNYGFGLYPIGFIFILAYLLINGYAMLFHQLADVYVVIRRTLLFTTLVASTFLIYGLGTYAINLWFQNKLLPAISAKNLFSNTLSDYTFSYATTFTMLLVISALILRKRDKKPLHYAFALYSLAIALWAGFAAIGVNVPSSDRFSIWWIRFCNLFALFVPPLFLTFLVTFIKKEKRTYAWLLRVSYVVAFLLIVANFTPLIVKAVGPVSSLKSWVIRGPLYDLETLCFIISVVVGMIILYRAMREPTTDAVFKKQVSFLFWATLVGYLGGTPNYLLSYQKEIPILMPYGNYGIAIYGLTLCYVIFRYRFLDIDVIIRRTLIFTGLVAAALLVFGTITYLFNTQLVAIIGFGNHVATILSLALVALSSDKIYRFLQVRTDRFLFQKKYEYQKVLKEVARGMAQITDLEATVGLIRGFLSEDMRIEGVGVYLLNEDSSRFIIWDSGDGHAVIDSGDPLVQRMREKRKPLIALDLRHLLRSIDELEGRDHSALAGHHAQVAVPSFVQDKLVSFFLLGEKKSGDQYNQIDIDTLETLAHDAAIALENARLYDSLKKSYEDLKQMQAQLVQQEKLATMGQLSAVIAHEMSNPLTVIGGQAKVRLEQANSKSTEEEQRFLQEVVRQSDRAAAIIKKLLAFSKPRRGETEQVELKELLEESLRLVHPQIGFDNVMIERAYTPHPLALEGHRFQLQEVFVNVLRNAFEAMPEGGRLALALHDEVGLQGREGRVTIKDSGPGIDPADKSHLFTPFHSTKPQGTGLGLFISKNIVAAHKGRLDVESRPGEGTTVAITLPVMA